MGVNRLVQELLGDEVVTGNLPHALNHGRILDRPAHDATLDHPFPVIAAGTGFRVEGR